MLAARLTPALLAAGLCGCATTAPVIVNEDAMPYAVTIRCDFDGPKELIGYMNEMREGRSLTCAVIGNPCPEGTRQPGKPAAVPDRCRVPRGLKRPIGRCPGVAVPGCVSTLVSYKTLYTAASKAASNAPFRQSDGGCASLFLEEKVKDAPWFDLTCLFSQKGGRDLFLHFLASEHVLEHGTLHHLGARP